VGVLSRLGAVDVGSWMLEAGTRVGAGLALPAPEKPEAGGRDLSASGRGGQRETRAL